MTAGWWSRLDTLVGAVLVILAAIGVVTSIGLFAGDTEADPASDRRRQTGLRPPIIVDYVYWLAGPLVERLAARRIRPNHVTAAALGLALLCGLALGAGYMGLGAVLLVVTGGCDLLDGYLARKLDRQSEAGAFFDSFADRIAEAFVLGGLAYFGDGGLLTWLAIWALVASFAISYARARAEGLGGDGTVGWMQRPERFGLLIITVGIAAVAAWPGADTAQLTVRIVTVGVGLLAVLATGTALRRAWSIFAKLRADDYSASAPDTSSSPLDPGADSES